MVWIKLLLDNQFESIWEYWINWNGLMNQQYGDMLWRSYAPECVLNRLHITLLADSLRTWYIYLEKACKEIHNTNFYDMGNILCLWFNKNIRSRTKQYFFFMRIGMKRVFSLSATSLIHLSQEVSSSKNWFLTLMFLSMIEENLIFLWNVFQVHGFRIQIQEMLTFWYYYCGSSSQVRLFFFFF